MFSRAHGRDSEALPSSGKCSSSRWKCYKPCLPSSTPSPKASLPSAHSWAARHMFSDWLKQSHLPFYEIFLLIWLILVCLPAGLRMHSGITQKPVFSCTVSSRKSRNMASGFAYTQLGLELASGPWTRPGRSLFWAGWPKNIGAQNGNCGKYCSLEMSLGVVGFWDFFQIWIFYVME